MPSAALERHPASPCAALRGIEASVARNRDGSLHVAYRLEGDLERVRIQPPRAPRVADKLWQHTCCELFIAEPAGPGYHEFNFSPSGEWAAYDFTAYREGRTNADVTTPYIRVEDNFTWWAFGATISVEATGVWEFGLSAILEETDGTKSYWAVSHPEGDKPDFHDAACFAAHLP